MRGEQEREPDSPFGVEVINPKAIYRALSLKGEQISPPDYPLEIENSLFLRRVSYTELGGVFRAEATEITGIKGRDATTYTITSVLDWPEKPTPADFFKKYFPDSDRQSRRTSFDMFKTYYPRKRVERVISTLSEFGLEAVDDTSLDAVSSDSEDEIIFSGLNQSRLVVTGPRTTIEIFLGYTGLQAAATFLRQAIAHYDNVDDMEENSLQDVYLAEVKRTLFKSFGQTIMGEAPNRDVKISMQFSQQERDELPRIDDEERFIQDLTFYATSYATITKALYQEAGESLPNRLIQIHL